MLWITVPTGWDALEVDTAAHLRRFSEQIEYSTENVEILMG